MLEAYFGQPFVVLGDIDTRFDLEDNYSNLGAWVSVPEGQTGQHSHQVSKTRSEVESPKVVIKRWGSILIDDAGSRGLGLHDGT